MAVAMVKLNGTEMCRLWKESGGLLPSGERWWLRGATRGDVAAKQAVYIEGHGWFKGPATERRNEAELQRFLVEACARMRAGKGKGKSKEVRCAV